MRRKQTPEWVKRMMACLFMLILTVAVLPAGQVHAEIQWTAYGKPGPVSSPQVDGFLNLNDITVDSSGNIYVADVFYHRIQKLNIATGEWTQWKKGGPNGPAETVGSSTLGEFYQPSSISVDQAGNIYVADTYNNRIQKLNIASGQWSEWKKSGGGAGTALGEFNQPAGVVIDSARNLLYVADSKNNRIQRLNLTTNAWTEWKKSGGAAGSALGEFNNPQKMAVDSSGSLYVADMGNNRVQKLTGTTWSLLGGSKVGTGLGEFVNLNAVAVDAAGNVYAADNGGQRIQKWTKSSGQWSQYGKSGRLPGEQLGEFNYPRSVAVDASGNLYVADTGNYRIQKLNVSNGRWQEWGKKGMVQGTGVGELSYPGGVAIDRWGNMYVADRNNDRIQKLTAATNTWSTMGSAGLGLGQFKSPYGVAVDKHGNLYVADSDNNRVQKLTVSTGTWTQWGKTDRSISNLLGHFYRPLSIAVDNDDNVYVADSRNNRIQKYSPATDQWTDWKRSTGGSGTRAGEFNSPAGVAVDAAGNVYVTDSSNHRVQMMTPDGTWRQLSVAGTTASNAVGGFSSPFGIAVDQAGVVYVGDTGNLRLQKYNPATATWSARNLPAGFGIGEASYMTGMGMSSTGELYMADQSGHRVNKLTFIPSIPSPPQNVSATAGTLGQVQVSFNPPADDGDAAITGYRVTSFPDGITADGTSSPITVSGLTNGTSYTFTVTAINSVGTSVPSAASGAAIPKGLPGAPTDVLAVAGNGQAQVSFTPPQNNGGSPVTSYVITASPGGRTATTSGSSATVTGLVNGTAYTFTVVAKNAVGSSVASDPSDSITPATIPGMPTGISAVAGDGEATVSFTPPVSNGGSAITKYVVTSSPGGFTAEGTGSPITVTGLTNGQAYRFSVVAQNGVGSSIPSSFTTWVTPRTPAVVPGAPTTVSATAGNGEATVSFTAPSNDGGSPITGYEVISSPGGLTAQGTSSPITITGLTNGTSYTFTVVAKNSVGSSVESGSSAAVTPVAPVTVPGAPTAVNATAGNGEATVSFTAPSNDGGSPVTGYMVMSSPHGYVAQGTESPITVTGLQNGTAYTFVVYARNDQGTSAASSPSAAVTPVAPVTVPGAPTAVNATAGNGEATVSFTVPSNDGGSPITGYEVISSPGGLTAQGTSSPITIMGLTNGTSYTFTVVAKNSVGSSVESGSSAAVTPVAPVTVPGAPTAVSATAGNGEATVSFTAPSNDGGSPVTGYMVMSSPHGYVAQGTESPITVTGLQNGTAYTFVVYARNDQGTSAASSPSAAVTPVAPVTVPGAPTAVSATAGNGEATVSFTAPSNDGGSPITGYEVISSPGGLTAQGTGSPITITGLTNGTSYTFTVVAKNSVGSSVESGSSAAVTPVAPVTVPGAPTAVSATAGNGEATVSFTVPSNDGGSPITGYEVISSPGGLTAQGTGSPITITGLTNGTTYTFTVVAKNSVGSSTASGSSAAVTPVAPVTVPGAPTNVTATAGDGTATVSFTPPTNNGGSPITGYTVISSPGGLTAEGTGSPLTITGLTNGTSYTFTVVAKNSVGSSVKSGSSAAVTPVAPVTVPGAPTNVTATAGDGKATVNFTVPSNDGGSSITGYEVISSPGGLTAEGTGSPITITGLTNGTTYTFTVVAKNSVGSSTASGSSAAVTPVAPVTVPGAPTNVTATAGDGKATVSFTVPSNDGGSSITGYEVISSPGGLTAEGTGSPITITGLTNGTTYTFTVVAKNSAGSSTASGSSAAVTPVAPVMVPGAPTNVTATAGDGKATVSFTPPTNNGGSPITGYTVISSPGGLTAEGTGSPITITGLTNGTTYTFTVVAKNSVGSSVESGSSTTVTPVAPVIVTVPEAPTNITATAGVESAIVSFTPPAHNGGSPITGYTVISSPGGLTAEGSSSPITVTGLTYGTSYTFTVIAKNSAGSSVASEASSSVTPIAPPVNVTVPEAPTDVTATPGVESATVSFAVPANDGGSPIIGYTVISSPGGLTAEGTGSPITVTGLTYGTSYTFTVIAKNSAGSSIASAASQSVTPEAPPVTVTVPEAPTGITAAAGDGSVTVSFTPPANNGGSPVTGYMVISSPGGLTAEGTGSPITITGLMNGTAYTFTVIAKNSAGSSIASVSSASVTPQSASTPSDDTDEPSNSGSADPVNEPSRPQTGVTVLVNGKTEDAGTATTSMRNEQTVTTIAVDQQKLESRLENEGQGAVVTIPVNSKSDIVVGELNGQIVKNMEGKQAVLQIRTADAAYTLPTQQINIDAVSNQLGRPVALSDIKIQVEIAAASADTFTIAENAASNGGFTLVAPPVHFTVKGTYEGKTVEVSRFSAYVERMVAIPEGTDPAKITTGVVVEPNGTVRHVPTRVTVEGGKYYAVINSLTNSAYSVVWHPLEFADAAGHWAQESVNDMGSRMVINGIGENRFDPDREVTRAEFAAMIVRGLGLKPEAGAVPFSDVQASGWQNSAVGTAYAYGLINGFEDGSFRPDALVTREQAMEIIAKAMKVTGLPTGLNGQAASQALQAYTDMEKAGAWALPGIADTVTAGIISGREGHTLAPKDMMTRAEAAAILQRLLRLSGLI